MVGGEDKRASDDAGVAAGAVGDDIHDLVGGIAQNDFIAAVGELKQGIGIAPCWIINQVRDEGVGGYDFEVGIDAVFYFEGCGGGSDDDCFVGGNDCAVGEAAYIFKIGGVDRIANGVIADVDGESCGVDEFDEFGVILAEGVVQNFTDEDVLRRAEVVVEDDRQVDVIAPVG